MEGALNFGLCTMHFGVRSMEWFLKIGYKSGKYSSWLSKLLSIFKNHFIIILGIKKHRVSGSADKKSVAARKKIIQRQFRRKMGLNIDMPRDSGHGTTNDGCVSNILQGAHKDIVMFFRR